MNDRVIPKRLNQLHFFSVNHFVIILQMLQWKKEKESKDSLLPLQEVEWSIGSVASVLYLLVKMFFCLLIKQTLLESGNPQTLLK